ncbi:ABC transporter substrate-binding protein [Pseudarthrobacter sp. NPDC058119]|uniref:ABC transporter substrate-binding protein n=1 Tax=Pseudarthrobacter sp. NPDC058119 TaxID=3346348 RepID=UPI0036DC2A76
MIHRKLTLAAAVVTATALSLTACSGGNAPAADLTSVSIMAPFLEAQPPAADGAVQKKLEELTGKQVKINWAPNASYEDKTNITLAGSDIPQVMVIQTKSPGFVKNAQAGAFWDLTDKLDKYPNLKTTFPDIQKNSSVNGKVYGLFRERSPMRTAVMFRQDWLDKLGLQPPKTVEDLYKVAKAFTEQDPDGNGINDTWGITIPKWGALGTNSPYDVIEEWFGAGNRWTERDGKLVPSFETDEFLQADRFIKKMVDEKLINPDFATFDPTKWNEPFFNGKAATIKPETPEGKAVSTDIKSYAQLGMNVAGNQFYPVKQATDYEQQVFDKRTDVMAEDLKSAVYNPAAPYVSATYVAKGAQLDNIVADARIKYLAGQIDEQGLKDAIKLWDTSGGDKVKEEINKLWQDNK